ncbi:MAG: hypothetical protein R3F59_35240 [Myxococcota bacterium]
MWWALLACADEDPVSLAPSAAALAAPEDWAPVADDPLPDAPPADRDCPAATWGPEAGALEVQTGACAWFAAAQPAKVALHVGDTVEATVWHGDLDAAAPGEGHVALWVGDAVLWETWVPIPHDAAVYPVSVTVDRDWPAGTPVGVHLHNHGFNSWSVDAVWRVTQ